MTSPQDIAWLPSPRSSVPCLVPGFFCPTDSHTPSPKRGRDLGSGHGQT